MHPHMAPSSPLFSILGRLTLGGCHIVGIVMSFIQNCAEQVFDLKWVFEIQKWLELGLLLTTQKNRFLSKFMRKLHPEE